MASSMGNRAMKRAVASSSSLLKSAVSKKTPISPPPITGPSTSTTSFPAGGARIYSFNKSSVERLGCVQSLLPLHTAVAIARLNSCLSASSTGYCSLSQEDVEGT